MHTFQDRRNKDNILPKLLGGGDTPGEAPRCGVWVCCCLRLAAPCAPSALPQAADEQVHVRRCSQVLTGTVFNSAHSPPVSSRSTPAEEVFQAELKKYDDLVMEVRRVALG